MKNILHEIYHGRFPKWDENSDDPKSGVLFKKIMDERRYFKSILSPEDYERFKALEKLHRAEHSIRDKRMCANAFRMGALHICTILFGEEEYAKCGTDDDF